MQYPTSGDGGDRGYMYKFSSTGILRDFIRRCQVGIQVTFLKISAFYIFAILNPNAPGLIHKYRI